MSIDSFYQESFQSPFVSIFKTLLFDNMCLVNYLKYCTIMPSCVSIYYNRTVGCDERAILCYLLFTYRALYTVDKCIIIIVSLFKNIM